MFYSGIVLTATGRGYSFSGSTLTFSTAANGNDYTIIRTGTGAGAVGGIVFPDGVSPASVTINDISLNQGITFSENFNAKLTFTKVVLGKALTLPANYNAPLEFNVVTVPSLTLPANYNAPLGINGLTLPSLTLPANYSLPLTFNGLNVTNGNITYPAGYDLPITISSNFRVTGTQPFPPNYRGPITVGGGTFTAGQRICRQSNRLNLDWNEIVVPDNISSIIMDNAKTGGTGSVTMQLGLTDNFTLLLSGNSNITGYIEVPPQAALTIDSTAGTGSESGTLAITYSGDYACIGNSNYYNAGPVTIQGGTVEATQTSAGGPAAIGGGAGKAGNVTITGGKVIANGNKTGAAIGSGESSKGGTVRITGGMVVATAGDISKIQLGSTDSYGAAIGSGKRGYFENNTITGGHVTAYSGFGAGIGTGGLETGEPGTGDSSLVRGSITITGGTLRGYTQVGANIGRGYGRDNADSYIPAYCIKKEADIYMTGRGGNDIRPGVECSGANGGDGYFVSAQDTDEQIRGDLYVYTVGADGKTTSLARKLLIPKDNVVYMSFLFSTGHDEPERFHIFTDFYDPQGNYKGMRQYIHHWDHVQSGAFHGTPIALIPSITDLISPKNYPHNFHNAFVNTLRVCFGEGGGIAAPTYYRVTEKFVDISGEPVPDKEDRVFSFAAGETYNGDPEAIDGYSYKGYKWDTAPNGSGSDFTSGNPSAKINQNRTVYFVYAEIPRITTVTLFKTVKGDYGDKTKKFPFLLVFTDDKNEFLPAGTAFSYTGDISGELTLGELGQAILELSHGQRVTIEGVPSYGKVQITEKEDDNYDVSFWDGPGDEHIGNEWSLTPDPLVVECVNTRKAVPETGITAGGAGTLLLFPLLAIAAALLFLLARKVYRRGKEAR